MNIFSTYIYTCPINIHCYSNCTDRDGLRSRTCLKKLPYLLMYKSEKFYTKIELQSWGGRLIHETRLCQAQIDVQDQ